MQLNFLDTMPRQLPWLNNGRGSQTQTKKPSRAKTTANASTDIDDDFFDGIVLAASNKGKGKAVQAGEDSDDDFPLPKGTGSGARDTYRKARAPSSSPPPIADEFPPEVEEMRKGVSRFELRDDEWMMVEDEFLETAKLFTRHMRLVEYEKLKEQIEAKKKVQVQTPRPVVAGGKLSAEGSMKKKAEVQEKRQRRAIQDVFASQDDDEGDEEEVQPAPFTRPQPTTASKQPPRHSTVQDSDSDDLDAPKPSFKRPNARPSTSTAKLTSGLISAPSPTGQKSTLPTAPMSSFTKPVLPAPKRPIGTARRSRFNIDMFDDYTPPTNTASPQPVAHAPKLQPLAKSAPSSSSPINVKTETMASDEWGSGPSKETASRIAKRKAEKEKERGMKKKSAKMDDIPTFLV